MNNDLISREGLKKAIKDNGYSHYFEIFDIIDNAPTIEPFERIGVICEENCGYRPQGELVEKLKDRIEERVCKYCQMNKHCELCEISRVFQIITLTAEEQKGGVENGN